MREVLEKQLKRFQELEAMMTDPEVLADSNRISAVARERGSLAKVATKYQSFKTTIEEIQGVSEMAQSDDPEEREMAELELPELRAKREQLWEDLLDMTVGGEDANRPRCIMEIRAGTGGDEAALFARDLYEMYKRHAEAKGWKVELLDASPTELGGFKEISLAFGGENVFRELQYESGGHRVQRVPETEAKGRIHTSAATVAVLAEPEDVEIDLTTEDYDVERYAASAGPGGQHVNKTASAVRLTHKATGLQVQCADERSQHKNLARALRLLKSKLYEAKKEEEAKKRADHRKTLVGSGDRSQRIRTYNFPENRVSDHRINLTLYKLDQVIAGDLQPLTDGLIEHDRNELRNAMGNLDE
ncbi:MAG TPA: peptide chain release factor 1 [Planctomycetaceae bacterium]|nr:peptide chain release factor 1 [Blastopirellula sp.]HAY79763.1 peptide chain release factor 1 [Planctomycetaceae bacterium]